MSTIKDVAREAGVSIATVSRVFNKIGSVNEDTRDVVARAARRLNYIPNPVGRSLSTRRTDAIGLLLPDLFGEFFSEVLRGSDQTAQAARYHLVVSSSHNNKEEIRAALTMMRGRVDGLIVMSPDIDAETLTATLPRTLPVVLLNSQIENSGFDSITVDNFGGACSMVRHLLGHGHTRIAVITGRERNFDSAERLRGYAAALRGAGLSPDPSLQVNGEFDESSGYEAVRHLLSLPSRPTAIFACNDSMAIGALSALRDQGVGVPEEIALAGFDDVPVASFLTPTLTSVSVGIHQLGIRAIQTVLHAFRHRNEHRKQQVVIPTQLSLRRSCGCNDPH